MASGAAHVDESSKPTDPDKSVSPQPPADKNVNNDLKTKNSNLSEQTAAAKPASAKAAVSGSDASQQWVGINLQELQCTECSKALPRLVNLFRTG